jgi:hypothetical protein
MPFATFPQNLKQQQDEENSHRRDGGHSPHSRNDGNNYFNGHFKSTLMVTDYKIRPVLKLEELNKKNESTDEWSLGDILLLTRFERELKEDFGWTKEQVQELTPNYYRK